MGKESLVNIFLHVDCGVVDSTIRDPHSESIPISESPAEPMHS